ncbi:ST3A1 sulfotransferase, partial [Eudromia elegans]|nr:ST3A1 sulfotransferase [Eudromia elegans]
RDRMEPPKDYIFNYKGFYFATKGSTPEYIDSLETFEIRDRDIFIATFPKSGTVWTQNILSLILHEGHRNGTEDTENVERIPWLEYNMKNADYAALPSPRVFATHLPYYLTPRDLRNKRARVIYVTRNPKDVLVSYFHFSKIMTTIEEVSDFNVFIERFLAGKSKICFLLKSPHPTAYFQSECRLLYSNQYQVPRILSLKEPESKAAEVFGSMPSKEQRLTQHTSRKETPEGSKKPFPKSSPCLQAGFTNRCVFCFSPLFTASSSGTIGDWKNFMTVAQSERVDEVLKKKMENLPIKFIWDMNDKM